MNEKQIICGFETAFKSLKAKKKYGHREYWVIEELDRLTKIMRGENDPGPLVGVALVQAAASVSRPTLSTWRNIGFPETLHNYAVPAEQLIAWLRRQWLRVQTRTFETEGGDPMLVGGDGSPNLEKYREYRAKMEELRWRREISQVVDRTDAIRDMHTILTTVWAQVERMIDKLPPLIRMKKAPFIRKKLHAEKNRVGKTIITKLEKLAIDAKESEQPNNAENKN